MGTIRTNMQLVANAFANETYSVAIATDGVKTLHITTKFLYFEDTGSMEPYTVFEITDRKTKSLYGFDDFEMAVEKYNEL